MKNFNNRLCKLEIAKEEQQAYTGEPTIFVDSHEEAEAIEKRIKKKYGNVKGLLFIIDDIPEDD